MIIKQNDPNALEKLKENVGKEAKIDTKGKASDYEFIGTISIIEDMITVIDHPETSKKEFKPAHIMLGSRSLITYHPVDDSIIFKLKYDIEILN